MFYKNDKLYTENEIRALYPNTSFTVPFNPQTLGFEVVFDTPTPEVTDLQVAYIDGTEIDGKGNRVLKYSIRDRFNTQEQIDEYLAQKAKQAVPQSVTMRQARLALLAHNLLDDIDSAIRTQDRAVHIEWEYATTVERNSPLVSALGVAINFTDIDIDNLFIEASKI